MKKTILIVSVLLLFCSNSQLSAQKISAAIQFGAGVPGGQGVGKSSY